MVPCRRIAQRSVPNEVRHEVVRLVPLPSRLATPVPRLRFDRVVQRLVGDLRAAFDGELPGGTTALVTLTAPIRLPGKTAAAIADAVRAQVARASSRDLVATLHGNSVRVRIARHSLKHAPSTIAFVHNREPHPHRLLDCASEWLAVLSSAARARNAERRCLQVHGQGRRALASIDRHVCSQLLSVTPFSTIVVVDDDGRNDVVAS